MKKLLVFSAALFFLAIRSTAQSNGMLSLSLGPAIPMGEFASKNAFSTSAGLADIGGLADLSYQHPFGSSRFGWVASLRGRFNGVNKSATFAPFEAQFPGFQQWSVNNSRWTTAAALLGAYYDIPLSRKLGLRGNIGFGIAESWSPKQIVTGIRDSVGFGAHDLVQGTLHSVSATSLTATAGLSVYYRWSSRWSLMAKADYTWLKPTFHNVTALIIYAGGLVVPGILSPSNASTLSAYITTHDYTQAMPTVNILVGVTYNWPLRSAF